MLSVMVEKGGGKGNMTYHIRKKEFREEKVWRCIKAGYKEKNEKKK